MGLVGWTGRIAHSLGIFSFVFSDFFFFFYFYEGIIRGSGMGLFYWCFSFFFFLLFSGYGCKNGGLCCIKSFLLSLSRMGL